MSIHFVLLILAVLCFFLSAIGVGYSGNQASPGWSPRLNLTALGLFFWSLSLVVVGR